MPITIYKAGKKYAVSVSPPDGPLWRGKEPMTPDEIFNQLIDLGCHTTDISDAFYAADPFWTRNEGRKSDGRYGSNLVPRMRRQRRTELQAGIDSARWFEPTTTHDNGNCHRPAWTKRLTVAT